MSQMQRAAGTSSLAEPPARPSGVVIFGASVFGRQLIALWPEGLRAVSAIVDNDPAKWGTVVENVVVQAPETLRQADPNDLVVVVASQYYDEIARQLIGMGFSEGVHFIRATDIHDHWALGGAASGGRPRGPLTLVVKCEWFDIAWRPFNELCRQADLRLAFAPAAEGRADLTLTKEGYATLRRHGVPLMAACTYDICVSLRVPIERLDPSLPDHWAAIVEHLRHAAAIVDVAVQALDRTRPAVVVIPQGYTKVAAVYRYLAVLRGIRVVALENSLNRHRLMWDDVAGLAVNRVVARNYFWRWSDLIDGGEAAAHVAWYLSSIKTLKQSQHESPDRAWSRPSDIGPMVLFLANVLTDSSVMFNSRVGSQVDAIKAAARWTLAEGHTFVLKVHPRERPGHCAPYEGLTVRALHDDQDFWRLASESSRFVIDSDNSFDTYDLIRQSSVCVTVCSQAGLEALMMGKETVVLGDAYYGGLGFTHDVQDRTQIGSAIAAALSASGRRLDPDRVARFFYVLDRLYCVEKSERGLCDVILRTLGRAPLATI